MGVVFVKACVWPSMNAASTTCGCADNKGLFRPLAPMPLRVVLLLGMLYATPLPLKPSKEVGVPAAGNGIARTVVMLRIGFAVADGAELKFDGSLFVLIVPTNQRPPNPELVKLPSTRARNLVPVSLA